MSSAIKDLASGSPALGTDLVVISRGAAPNFKLTLAQVLLYAGIAIAGGVTSVTGANAANVFAVRSNSGDRLRVFPNGAGGGVTIDSTNNAEGAYAPLTFFASGYSFGNGNLVVSRADVGGTVISQAQNTDNTSALSGAVLYASVGGSSAGDPCVYWLVPGATDWSAGIDNSDFDKWKLSLGGALGTNDCITVGTDGTMRVTMGDFRAERSNAGGNVWSIVYNTDTANAGSHAALYALTGGASAGDPKVHWEVFGVTLFTAGIDNSDGDKWKLSINVDPGTNTVLVIDTSKRAYWQARVSEAQGSTVASATNVALGDGGNRFQISGTTQIDLIDNSNWQGGSRVTLHFQGSLTVRHNQAASGNNKPIMLAGAANFSATANDQLTLQYDSTDSKWYEIARVVI